MDTATANPTPTAAEPPKPPMTPEQLVDLRRRVLAGETVTDEELRHALSSLAIARTSAATASATKATKSDGVDYTPKGSLADRMAAFKAKQQAEGKTP